MELLIEISPLQTRVALLEGGRLVELQIEPTRRSGLVGNLYLGRVERCLPSLQAALVDIGLGRAAFLHERDLPPSLREKGIRPGQELLVQVEKEPLGTKGARLTADIALPSRLLVYFPFGSQVGVSQRIEEEEERARLLQLLASFRKEGGWIARTAAEGVSEEDLLAEKAFLERLWREIETASRRERAPALLHRELPLELRALRDLYRQEVERIWINDREGFRALRRFAETFLPEALPKIALDQGVTPLFERYGLEEEIRTALAREVPLPSGGTLVFDQTEAMTTIDVNTGSSPGGRSLEETAFKTNLEAALEIARQIRLRHLGGIIVIDFIDMAEEAHREQVVEALKGAMAGDRSRWQIGPISPMGLVEMTRKRSRKSLLELLCEPCPTCGGRGWVKRVETVCMELMREVVREARRYRIGELLVIAAPDVLERLLSEEAFFVEQVARSLPLELRFRADPAYTQEQFELIPLVVGRAR